MSEDRRWLIRKSGLFYRPDRSGYTAEVVAAGLYTEAEALAEASIEPHAISAVPVENYRIEIEYARYMLARFDGLI